MYQEPGISHRVLDYSADLEVLRQQGFKLAVIDTLLAAYPELPFVLMRNFSSGVKASCQTRWPTRI